MSILASEKDWAESEPDRSEAEGPTDLHDQFTRVLAKSVKEFVDTFIVNGPFPRQHT